MINFDDVYKYITDNNNFGLLSFINGAYDVYISNGIKYALENQLLNPQELTGAIKQFYNGDYGTAYEYDETPTAGHEYGQYKTSIDADGERAYIWAHREKHPAGIDKDYFCIYFHFER